MRRRAQAGAEAADAARSECAAPLSARLAEQRRDVLVAVVQLVQRQVQRIGRSLQLPFRQLHPRAGEVGQLRDGVDRHRLRGEVGGGQVRGVSVAVGWEENEGRTGGTGLGVLEARLADAACGLDEQLLLLPSLEASLLGVGRVGGTPRQPSLGLDKNERGKETWARIEGSPGGC